MPIETLVAVSLCLFAIAILYSSVGHAGASGYIAVLTLFSLAPSTIRPVALILNIAVSLVASYQFYKAGYFSFPLYWRFSLLAIPLSFLGGSVSLPVTYFKVTVGFVLVFSAIRFLFPQGNESEVRNPSTTTAICVGGGLGLLAGLTGTGGGIFLTPLLLIKKWALTKNAAAVSAVFILTNSIAGLLGNIGKTRNVSFEFLVFLPVVLAGGYLGSRLGSRKFDNKTVRRLLSAVLMIAGAKLIAT